MTHNMTHMRLYDDTTQSRLMTVSREAKKQAVRDGWVLYITSSTAQNLAGTTTKTIALNRGYYYFQISNNLFV